MELMKVSLIQGSYKDGGVGACEVLRTAVPAFLAPGASFIEDSFSRDAEEGWFRDDLSIARLLGPLFFLLFPQLHLTSAGIRSQGLGTPED